MPIKHNASNRSGGRITEPGDYKVKVSKFEEKKSKAGEDMLVITFVTPDDRKIDGYYLKGKPWTKEDLIQLRKAAGVAENAAIGSLFGAEIGIAVVAGKPKEDGSVFMSIRGYGPAGDVDGNQLSLKSDADDSIEVPF